MPIASSAFICYAKEDFHHAETVHRDLIAMGVQPWMDKKDLIGGQDWERAVTTAIRNCDFFVFCASPRSVSKRGQVQREIHLALELWAQKLEDDLYFIPLRLEECVIPDSIKRFQWIDYFEVGGSTQLKRSIVAGLAKQEIVPPLPIEVINRKISLEIPDSFTANLNYPEFSPATSIGIPECNAELSVFARGLLSNFQVRFAPEPKEPPRRIPYFLNLNYDVRYTGKNAISVTTVHSIYTGGAHPNSYTRAFNFIRDPWHICTIDQLPDPTNFMSFIEKTSSICIENIKQQRLTEDKVYGTKGLSDPETQVSVDDWLSRGAGPILDNFSNFYLDRGFVGFIFDNYQVGSRADGRREVKIPFEKLEGAIRGDIVDLFS